MELFKNKLVTGLFALGMALAGAVGVGAISFASAQATSTTSPAATSDRDQTDTWKQYGHFSRDLASRLAPDTQTSTIAKMLGL